MSNIICTLSSPIRFNDSYRICHSARVIRYIYNNDHPLWVVWLNLCMNTLDKSIEFDIFLHFEQGHFGACNKNTLCVCPLDMSIVIYSTKNFVGPIVGRRYVYEQVFRNIIVSVLNSGRSAYLYWYCCHLNKMKMMQRNSPLIGWFWFG